MPSTQLPGIGLYKGWSVGEKGWGDEINANFCKLDALAAAGVTGQIASADLPATGNQGEQYLLTDTNEIATFQGGVWLKCAIPKGMPILDCASGTMYTFDGASVIPMEVNIPEATVADVLAAVPDLFVTSEVLCNSFNDIFGAGVITGIVPPTAAPGPKELPIYCDTVTAITYVWDGAAWVSKEAAEPPFTIVYDEAGAGAASADLYTKTGPDGCLDPMLTKRYPTFATTTAFEAAIGGAGNLVGGERMYDPALGVPVVYNALTGVWMPEVAEPCQILSVTGLQGGTLANNTLTTLLYPTIVRDDFGGAYNPASGIFTVPAGMDGCYIIDFKAALSVSINQDHIAAFNVELFINGAPCDAAIDFWDNRSGFGLVNYVKHGRGTHIAHLIAGQTLEVRMYQLATPVVNYNFDGNKRYSHFQLIRLGRP